MELPNTIEELLKVEVELTAALFKNLEENAGKPGMADKERALIDQRDAVRSKLGSLGYVKPNIPKCSPLKEGKACCITANACNFTQIERLSIGCLLEPGINPPGATGEAKLEQGEGPKKRKRKRRKKESHSRAARAGRAAGVLQQLADELDASCDNLRDLVSELGTTSEEEEAMEELTEQGEVAPEGETAGDKAADIADIKKSMQEEVTRISNVFDESFSSSEIEDLASEMRSWSDNVQGTNLENTDKMQTVGETADTMEQASSTLDGLTFPEYDEDDVDSFIQELEQLANEIRDVASDVENCEFPGMYG